MDNIFRPPDLRAQIDRRRRYLPHWRQPGCAYFVTFRTADSLPQSRLLELRTEKEAWWSAHPEPWDDATRRQFHQRFTEKVQAWLDLGYGACVLQNPELREIVEGAMRHFHNERYVLDEFAIMPNHIHVLLKPDDDVELDNILHSWKSYSANQINRSIGRSGQFWLEENFDHLVRSWEYLEGYRTYIRENPVKAGLSPNRSSVGRGLPSLMLEASE
jgi:REP element-mobilizing transposase RayT